MVPEAPTLAEDVPATLAMGMQESNRGRKRVVFAHLKEEKTPGDIHESLGTRGCTWTTSTPSNRVIAINSCIINHKNESL
jgi:hypothetical protein